jgi:hypothetical protein
MKSEFALWLCDETLFGRHKSTHAKKSVMSIGANVYRAVYGRDQQLVAMTALFISSHQCEWP